MKNQKFDAIVIGGGHNGLISAAYLQRNGLNTLVIERRSVIGGACVTEELFPGFKVSRAAYVCSLLRPEIIRDLELKKFGYEIILRDPSSFSPFLDGRSLTFWRDKKKTCAEIAKFSRKDAERFLVYEKKLEEMSQFIRPLLMETPPDPTSSSPKDLLRSLKLLMRVKALRSELYEHLRVFSMSVAEYLDQWFESKELKVRLATDGIIGAWAGPYSPGTAYVLFHHVMGETDGVPGVWGYVRGGMGQLSEALAKSLESKGGTIIKGAAVDQLIVKEGKAVGVALKDGKEFYAKQVLSNLDPHRTFLNIVDKNLLPDDFIEGIKNFRMKSGTVKINIAANGLPDFKSMPGTESGPQHCGTIHICPSMDYIERAFEDAKRGLPSSHPSIELTIPSTVDDSLAPEGKHVFSLFVQYAPYNRSDGRSWDSVTKKEFAETCFKEIAQYAPNFPSLVDNYEVLTPVDLEREFGLTGGNIMHGEMTVDQLFFMRPLPRYAKSRTPIKNFYLCGSGAHPGGGVMGAPGYIAAKTVLSDRGLGRFLH